MILLFFMPYMFLILMYYSIFLFGEFLILILILFIYYYPYLFILTIIHLFIRTFYDFMSNKQSELNITTNITF